MEETIKIDEEKGKIELAQDVLKDASLIYFSLKRRTTAEKLDWKEKMNELTNMLGEKEKPFINLNTPERKKEENDIIQLAKKALPNAGLFSADRVYIPVFGQAIEDIRTGRQIIVIFDKIHSSLKGTQWKFNRIER